MDIHEAFAWYDRAIDNAIDYLNLDREEQDKAWNVIDKFIDEAMARQSATSLIPHNINYYKCKNCEQLIHKYIHKPKYCPSCGKPVKGGLSDD